MAVRLAMLDHHYRRPWDWHDDLLAVAAERLERWRSRAGGDGPGNLDAVRAALDDDLAIPRALALVDEAARGGESVDRGAELLGVRL